MAERRRERPGPMAKIPDSGINGTLKGLVRRLADLLPPPRDEALLAIARDAYSLLSGTPADTGTRARRSSKGWHEPWLDPMAFRRIRHAYEAARYDTALQLVEEVLERHPDSIRALMLARDIHARRGDVTGIVATLHRIRQLKDEPRFEFQERQWMGRLIETDPRWLPRIPGPPRPIVPRNPRVVMHLLKESIPYLQNGFTMRSRYTLLAQRAAGLEPFVVTSLGFPRKEGIDDFPLEEEIEGIRHHRLDLGPGYSTTEPFDVNLRDYAWLASRVARRERPAVIHASSGFRGFDTALVGMALREHLRLPLVYEVRSFFETTWTADHDHAEQAEHYERRHSTENRAMQAADAVITIGESMRADIVARGVPAERVFVLPNGVDPEAFQPMDPDPELRRRYGLEGKMVFGYVSNLDHPREGQELLIDATAALLRRGRKVACLIVGDGGRRPELEERARKAGVGGSVVFTGRIPHAAVRAHYALLDVFVVPRRNDRASRYVTPLKPFEAMAMGKPVVVSDLPALVEIAAPGERGLAFPHDDAAGLAATLEQLIDHPDLIARYGEAGRQWVLAERTWAANGERYRAIYEGLAAGHGLGGEATEQPAAV